MTRFFAHLCLYLQLIDIAVSPLAIQIILEAYLQVLEARRHYPSQCPPPRLASDEYVLLNRVQASVRSSPCTPVLWATTPSNAMPSS
jgi:hypothetical protein